MVPQSVERSKGTVVDQLNSSWRLRTEWSFEFIVLQSEREGAITWKDGIVQQGKGRWPMSFDTCVDRESRSSPNFVPSGSLNRGYQTEPDLSSILTHLLLLLTKE